MPRWIRMKDPSTGHHFDVPEGRVEAMQGKGVEAVPDYPPHAGRDARPPKPRKHIETTARRRRRTESTEPAAQPDDPTGSEEA